MFLREQLGPEKTVYIAESTICKRLQVDSIEDVWFGDEGGVRRRDDVRRLHSEYTRIERPVKIYLYSVLC